MTIQCTQIRTRIGSWNVQTLFQKRKLTQLNREMATNFTEWKWEAQLE
jgi:hypothetical protein